MKNIFSWLLKAIGCLLGFCLLGVIGAGIAFLWIQSQLYSAVPLSLPAPNGDGIPDLRQLLFNSGKIEFKGEDLAGIVWSDKPPELEALAINIAPFEEAGSCMHVQTSVRVDDSDKPFLNIDAKLSFHYENKQFVQTQIHSCTLGKLDLTRWCKGYDLNKTLTDGIQEQAASDIVLQSTLGLVERAYLNDNSLVIEIHQEDLLQNILQQLEAFDPNMLEQLQNMDLNIEIE
jgi:hypothetical protein